MNIRSNIVSRSVLVSVITALTCCLAFGSPLPEAKPSKAGYSKQRLETMHNWIQSQIDEGKHAGAVTLIARDGKIVDWHSYGSRDIATNDPMEKDDIFRIFSMSKVMVSVAALTLLEEGEFLLSDPVSKFIPEIAKMKVYVSGEKGDLKVEDQRTPMTIKHLFTHTSGIPYDFTAEGALKEIYSTYEEFNEKTGEGFIHELVKKPLVHQPGARSTYGMSTDVLGRVIEVISGMSLGEFLKLRLFDPLQMHDTGFTVPSEKLDRLVSLYTYHEKELKELGSVEGEGILASTPPIDGSRLTGIESGGGGLYSTAADYVRFAQMLLNDGELNGVRILSPKTVEYMMLNHLEGVNDETHNFSNTEGFGLGVSVRLNVSRGNTMGSVGQYGWTGAATTYYSADPVEQTIALLMIQHMPYDQHGVFPYFSNLCYQALIE